MQTLVKKEYQVEVPVYKCVVQYLCPECAQNGAAGIPTTAPPPPQGHGASETPPRPCPLRPHRPYPVAESSNGDAFLNCRPGQNNSDSQ